MELFRYFNALVYRLSLNAAYLTAGENPLIQLGFLQLAVCTVYRIWDDWMLQIAIWT